MNVINKFISFISPQTAVKRELYYNKYKMLSGWGVSGYGHHGASRTKKSLKGWHWHSGSHKEDIEDNLTVLRQRSRDLYAGGANLATGAIKTMRTNVVGVGLKAKPTVDREILELSIEQANKLNKQIEREFSLWADSAACDLQGLDNFQELQQLVYLNWLLSGDVIVTLPTTVRSYMPYNLRINLIEADRVCNPNMQMDTENIISGIETNDLGEVEAYHICKRHPNSTTFEIPQEWIRVEAVGKQTGRRNVLHIMNRERIGQRRGLPFLSPIIETLKQVGTYTDAELMAAVISGMFTVFIEKKDATSEMPFGSIGGEMEYEDFSDDIKLGNGSIIDLNPGETVHDSNPGRPNTAFDGFVTALCRQIGSALEIPFEILLKHFSSSYSASRGALLEFWKSVKMYREWLASDFCQPIYEEWLTEAVAIGRISAPGFFSDPLIKKAYCGCEWNGPANGQLDPLKEVNAAEKRVANGFSNRERETVELTGGDFYSNIDKLKAEEFALKEVKTNEK